MTITKPTLIVLAAGMGSRYGGLKQIDPVGPGGETLLDYSIFDAERAGFGEVIFVIRRDIEDAFEASVGGKYATDGRISVRYAFQELDDLPDGFSRPEGREKPWGTAHATLAARDLINGPFAVINADDFYGARAFELLCAQLSERPDDYAMVGFVLRETLSTHGTVTRGVCRTDGGFLEQLDEISGLAPDGDGVVYPGDAGETRRLTGEEAVSMNFWGFSAAILPVLEEGFAAFLGDCLDDPKAEYLLPDAVHALVSRGTSVRVIPGGGPWFGVTYQEDRETVVQSIRKLIDDGVYPERIWG